MPHDFRRRNAPTRRVVLLAEGLESRTLLTGSRSAAHGLAAVAIQVPGEYISQQSSALDVTLVRKSGAGRAHARGPLTVEFSAQPGTIPGGPESKTPDATEPFTPVNLQVTFPAGVTTTTAVVPINPVAPNPGLVPIVLSVTSPPHVRAADTTTVYLASGPSAVPPMITSAHLSARGKSAVAISVTFSKPMAPATVQNIHNYKITYKESQEFDVSDLTGFGLLGQLNNQKQTVALKAAHYDPATATVTLIPRAKLKLTGTYSIESPASLGSRRHSAHQAQPLADQNGNAVNLGTSPVLGTFSVSISRGHPYFDTQPVFARGS